MRVVSVVLFVALFGSVALADEAKSAKAKVPLRVVKILPETHQALLFDKNHGTHVLAEVGQTVDGYKVEDIDDDEVTLAAASGAEIVLVAPWRHEAGAKPVDEPKPVTAELAPVDPYGEPVRIVEAPQDPYAEPAVRVAEAPAVVRSVDAPVATPVTTTPVAPTPPVDAPALLTRAEVTASLADFGKLAGSIRGAFTPAGLRVDAVADGSLFGKAGLRAADIVGSVDNQPLRSIDDAAGLYARAGTARNVTIQVVRGGKPLVLRVAIQ